VKGLGRKALGGVVTSLGEKRIIYVDVTFVNQGWTRTGRPTKGTRIVQITFPEEFRNARFEEK
jgi:precorrin isomerase